MFISSSETLTNAAFVESSYSSLYMYTLHPEARKVDPRATRGKRMRLLLLIMTLSLSLAVNMNEGGVRNNDNLYIIGRFCLFVYNDTDTDNDMNTGGVMINIYRLLLCDVKVPYAISNPPGSTSNW